MITVQINPPDIDDEYLRCLNVSYNPWGNRQQYDWHFRRTTAYPDADLIVLRTDGQMAAGSAVSYRRVALPNNNEMTVGLVTGAWTLPQFRDQGCFAHVIRESVKLTKQKHGVLLLGFVKGTNASSRQMARLGSAMFPSSYLTSMVRDQVSDAVKFKPVTVKRSEQVIGKLFEKRKNKSLAESRFVYATGRDFSSQFIHRPWPTELVSDGHQNFGLIETRERADVLQLVISDREEGLQNARTMAGFLNYAREKGRQLLGYTTSSAIRDAAVKAGFETTAGYLTVLIADENKLSESLELSSPLTKADSYLLAQPDSPCFLGPWNLQNGDRL